MTEARADRYTAERGLAALRARLDQLQGIGAQSFDPVNWHLIDALLSRAGAQPESVARHIVHKAEQALNAYEVAVTLARSTAEQTMQRIATRSPAHSATAHQLFSDGRFRELARLDGSLAHSSHQQMLAGLNQQLDQQPCAADDNHSFADSLRQQDREIAAVPAPHIVDVQLPTTTATSAHAKELKSARRCRAARAKHQANHVINRALAQCPTQSGPLNPQLLIVRSLCAMRDLSPHYVNLLVSQVTTLLWLEQASAQAAPRKPAKKAPRKRSQ